MSNAKPYPSTASLRQADKVKWITVTGLFLAMTIIISSSIFSIPVPGGHLYLCDVIIATAALLLDPLAAFAVGGIGSFLGDLLFYPAPMFVSLVTHGLQAVIISLIAHSSFARGSEKKHFIAALIGTLIGAVIMVVGYTLGKIYVYSTFEYAMLKLPYEIAQGLLGVFGSLLLYFKAGIGKLFKRIYS